MYIDNYRGNNVTRQNEFMFNGILLIGAIIGMIGYVIKFGKLLFPMFELNIWLWFIKALEISLFALVGAFMAYVGKKIGEKVWIWIHLKIFKRKPGKDDGKD